MKISILILLFIHLSIKASEKYILPCDAELLELSMKIAFEQVGMIEGNCNNKIIGEYLKAVGIISKAPYCAAGQYYCFKKASEMLVDCQIPFPPTGIANEIFDYASKHGKRKKYYTERHCFIIWKLPKSWKGHIERVVKIHKAGWVTTIAFNVKSRCNGRQCEGVFLKKRNIYEPLGRLKIRGIVGFEEILNKNYAGVK